MVSEPDKKIPCTRLVIASIIILLSFISVAFIPLILLLPVSNEMKAPLWVIKGHLTRTFKKGMWLALDCGYGYGAETYVDDVERNAIISGMRLGLTYALPLSPKHSLKFNAITGIRFKQEGDFDAVGVVYQYRWMKKPAK